MGAPAGAHRPVADRVLPRRHGAHGALQLALRPPARRHVHPAHRGHRRRSATATSGRPGIVDGDAVARAHRRRGALLPEPAARPTTPRRPTRSGPAATSTPATARARRSTSARGRRGAPGYDGHCRDRGLARAPGVALRFRVPDEGETVVHDLIRGDVAFAHGAYEDFVVVKSNGVVALPAGQPRRRPLRGHHPRDPRRGPAADHAQAGDDVGGPQRAARASSPSRCPPTPTCRCSSTSSARSSPSAATRSPSSSTGTRASCPRPSSTTWPCSAGARAATPRSSIARRLVEQFDLEDVSHSPAFFDVAKLTHVNGEYVRALTTEEFVERVRALGRARALGLATAGRRAAVGERASSTRRSSRASRPWSRRAWPPSTRCRRSSRFLFSRDVAVDGAAFDSGRHKLRPRPRHPGRLRRGARENGAHRLGGRRAARRRRRRRRVPRDLAVQGPGPAARAP